MRHEHSDSPKSRLITLTSREPLHLRASPNALNSIKEAVDVLQSLRPSDASGEGLDDVASPDETASRDAGVQSLFTLHNHTGLGLACQQAPSSEDALSMTDRMELDRRVVSRPLAFVPRKALVHLPDLARKVRAL